MVMRFLAIPLGAVNKRYVSEGLSFARFVLSFFADTDIVVASVRSSVWLQLPCFFFSFDAF